MPQPSISSSTISARYSRRGWLGVPPRSQCSSAMTIGADRPRERAVSFPAVLLNEAMTGSVADTPSAQRSAAREETPRIVADFQGVA